MVIFNIVQAAKEEPTQLVGVKWAEGKPESS
jgi:hypothetical protein